MHTKSVTLTSHHLRSLHATQGALDIMDAANEKSVHPTPPPPRSMSLASTSASIDRSENSTYMLESHVLMPGDSSIATTSKHDPPILPPPPRTGPSTISTSLVQHTALSSGKYAHVFPTTAPHRRRNDRMSIPMKAFKPAKTVMHSEGGGSGDRGGGEEEEEEGDYEEGDDEDSEEEGDDEEGDDEEDRDDDADNEDESNDENIVHPDPMRLSPLRSIVPVWKPPVKLAASGEVQHVGHEWSVASLECSTATRCTSQLSTEECDAAHDHQRKREVHANTACSLCKHDYSRPSSAATEGSLARCPKYLDCLHTFCLPCVVSRAGEAARGNSLCVSCPLCARTTLLLPAQKGSSSQDITAAAASLPTAHASLRHLPMTCQNCDQGPATWRCASCPPSCALLCEGCCIVHRGMKAFRSHEVDLLPLPGGPEGPAERSPSSLVEPEQGQGGSERATSAVHRNKRHAEILLKSLIEQQQLLHSEAQGLPASQTFLRARFGGMFEELAVLVAEREGACLEHIEGEYRRRRHALEAQAVRVAAELARREQLLAALGTIEQDTRDDDFQLLSVASFAETCALALKQEPLDDESCDLTARPLASRDMQLFSGSAVAVTGLLTTCGQVRGSAGCAEACLSRFSVKQGAVDSSLVCLQLRIELVDSGGRRLRGGGSPVTVELLDVAENRVLLASSHQIVSDAAVAFSAMHEQEPSPSPAFLLLDNMDGSYDFVCYSRSNLFVSCHVKVLGEHVAGSPSLPLLLCCLDDRSHASEVFGPSSGAIAHTSSTLKCSERGGGRVGPETLVHSSRNLRVCGSETGWMSASSGAVIETVAVTFTDLVLLHRVVLMNWDAATFQISVRRWRGHVAGGGSDHDPSSVNERRREGEGLEEWVCLEATARATAVPLSRRWEVVVGRVERARLGPVDALRLDVSGGHNTAFFGLNVFGFALPPLREKCAGALDGEDDDEDDDEEEDEEEEEEGEEGNGGVVVIV